MINQVADIVIPDSKVAAEATDLLHEYGTELIYNHSHRVFIFGALRGKRANLKYDPELLYVSAIFHDLGLVKLFSSADERFEVDGANAARNFPAPDFKHEIVHAFLGGFAHMPCTCFGNVKADICERLLPGYVRPNFVDIIENSPWAE